MNPICAPSIPLPCASISPIRRTLSPATGGSGSSRASTRLSPTGSAPDTALFSPGPTMDHRAEAMELLLRRDDQHLCGGDARAVLGAAEDRQVYLHAREEKIRRAARVPEYVHLGREDAQVRYRGGLGQPRLGLGRCDLRAGGGELRPLAQCALLQFAHLRE